MASLVKITSLVNHDYLKKGQKFMGLLNGNNVQFVLQNGYPTMYSSDNFEIEPLNGFFGEKEFICNFGN